MGRKSAAQLRRLQKRAAERGETFVPPPPPAPRPESTASQTTKADNVVDETQAKNKKLREIAERLQKELKEIEENEEMKAKDRRSAKRKAEAIAAEDGGMSSTELLEWYAQNCAASCSSSNNKNNNNNGAIHDADKAMKLAAAEKLLMELEAIDKNEELKSKDRRSAKRKAEVIASESTSMTAQDLLEWYKKNKQGKNQSKSSDFQRKDPLIAFFGQLSYDTSKEDLMEHIRSNLGSTYKISDETVRIRMLTTEKTKRSRGMAFVEVDDPDFLYALLKMHQTYLKGRRINVEKTTGGKKNSETRKKKLEQFKKEQEAHFAQVVEHIFAEYKKTGELRDDELDEGVITLCKRHSGPVVQAAVAEYIEKGGRDVDNPSAYLTFLVTKFAKEGIHGQESTGKAKKQKSDSTKKRSGGPSSSSYEHDKKRAKTWEETSSFAKSGVDMSISAKNDGGNRGKADLSKIFPSSQRGKSRGYMRNVRHQ
jgi:RNA recognition motif-containing protein